MLFENKDVPENGIGFDAQLLNRHRIKIRGFFAGGCALWYCDGVCQGLPRQRDLVHNNNRRCDSRGRINAHLSVGGVRRQFNFIDREFVRI